MNLFVFNIFFFGLLLIRDIISQIDPSTDTSIATSQFNDAESTSTYVSVNGSTSISSTTRATTTQTSVGTTTSFAANPATFIFWVKIVLSMEFSENITNNTVKGDLEQRLSKAYDAGYSRTANVGRRKRAATIGANTLYLVSVTRPTSTLKSTTLVYYVRAPDFVSPSTVVSNMNQLSLQELSIIMGRPVLVVATLYDASTQALATDDKFWIFGAVFGSLAGTAFLIWLVLFVYRRCLIPVDEPLLSEKSQLDTESHTELIRSNEDSEKAEKVTHKLQHESRNVGSQTPADNQQSETYVRSRNHHDEHWDHYGDQSRMSDKYTYEGIKSQNDSRDSRERIRSKRAFHVSDQLLSSRRSRYANASIRRRKRSRVLKTEVNAESDVRPQTSSSQQVSYLTSIGETEQVEETMTKPIAPRSQNVNNIVVESLKDQIDERNDADDEVIQPVAFNDGDAIKHIYPIYNSDIVIPDTTLNLVENREVDKLEEGKRNLNTVESKKKNVRTLDPVPIRRT